KVAALVAYFQKAADLDKIWAIALLTGNKPKRPVKTTDLRIWAAEMSGLPIWLVEESYYVVGDLAETLAHIIGYRPHQKIVEVHLHDAIAQLKNLLKASEQEKKEVITSFWRRGDKDENFVFNKL